MYTKKVDATTDEVMKNLLSAHKRIAGSGSVSELIKLSRYLLRVSKQSQDVLVNVCPESYEQRDK